MKTKHATLLLGFVTSMIGVMFVVDGCGEIWSAHQSRNWPKVKGVIIESSVWTKRQANRRRTLTEKPKILYRYTVGETELTGDRPIFGSTVRLIAALGLARSASDVTRQYPKDQSVDVYYHPDSPENSVLEIGIRREAFAPACFGAIFAIAGGVVLLRGLRES